MTRLALLTLLAVAGCSQSPESLGITGPRPVALPPDPNAGPMGSELPGVPDSGLGYGPSIGPAPSNGRYYNYN